jgi:hypothetical protein
MIAWYKTTTTGPRSCACGNYTTNHHRDESRGADFFQSPLRTYPRCRDSQNGRIARATNSVLRCTDTVLHGALRHRLVAHDSPSHTTTRTSRSDILLRTAKQRTNIPPRRELTITRYLATTRQNATFVFSDQDRATARCRRAPSTKMPALTTSDPHVSRVHLELTANENS